MEPGFRQMVLTTHVDADLMCGVNLFQMRRKPAGHERREAVVGHEKRMRFDPAVLDVRTVEYLRVGVEDVAGTVTEPRTWTN